MMKKYVVASLISLSVFLLAGVSSAWSYEANFTYTPGDSLKKSAPSNSIVVGGVNYRTNMKVRWAGLPQLAKFDGALWSASVPFTLASFQEPGFWKMVSSLTWKERNAQQTINNTSVAKTIDTAELSSEGMDEVVRGLEMQYSGLMGDLARSIDAKAVRSAASGKVAPKGAL